MGLKPYYLGDTSAVARLAQPEVSVRLVPLIESGLVARCTPTDLEAGFSSTGPASHLAMRQERAAWPLIAMDQRVLDRVVEVQDALAARSQQRGAKIADLLIAAVAEAAGLVVLHYDHDFDLIADVTGQPAEWVVAPDRYRNPALHKGRADRAACAGPRLAPNVLGTEMHRGGRKRCPKRGGCLRGPEVLGSCAKPP